MIIGIGTDLVDIKRIEKSLLRNGERFEKRCFTAYEQKQASSKNPDKKASFYAKRFAAKEALVKAIGTGFIEDVFLKDIEVKTDDLGRPSLNLSNGTLAMLNKITPDNTKLSIHLSLTDDYPYASAFVVIEALPL